ncbi:hypothetical protein V6N11_070942 [Hibiscus sabdariffa]|uniref:Uncharacterized protein n=1 Tax=Hibiscus sabdariffa TaxID=183260 RepID=A0ABR1Z9L1_9ROSI
MVLQNDVDLLNPPAELEKKKHKLKRLVQSPNSFFMLTCLAFSLAFMSYNYCILWINSVLLFLSAPKRMSNVKAASTYGSMPADWRQSQAHRRLLFQEEGRLNLI